VLEGAEQLVEALRWQLLMLPRQANPCRLWRNGAVRLRRDTHSNWALTGQVTLLVFHLLWSETYPKPFRIFQNTLWKIRVSSPSEQ
jgi:hypothetical protein